MNCPHCGHRTDVMHTESVKTLVLVRRYRKCPKCRYRFTTKEAVEKKYSISGSVALKK